MTTGQIACYKTGQIINSRQAERAYLLMYRHGSDSADRM